MGVEEFVALLPGTDLDEAYLFAERVRMAFERTSPDGAPRVTASAGAAAEVAPDRLERLVRSADIALYAAKAQGRNRTVLDRREIVAAGAKSPDRSPNLSK